MCHCVPQLILQNGTNYVLIMESRSIAKTRHVMLHWRNTRCLSLANRAWWRSCLKHGATSRKVAGSIPDDVLDIILRLHYGPEVDSTSNRNESQEYFLGVKGGLCAELTTLPPSCAECLKIWKNRPSGTLRAWPEITSALASTLALLLYRP